MRDRVQAIIAQQTGCQAQWARNFGHQEAATQCLARLLPDERLEPRHLADAALLHALVQLPSHGPVRRATDWTIAGHQHLRVVSLIVGRRAVPIYWRAYDAMVRKGRLKRSALAVIRRAVTRVRQKVGRRRTLGQRRYCARHPTIAVGDDAPEMGCPGPMGALVFSGQSAL
jgi:hypothetical protein